MSRQELITSEEYISEYLEGIITPKGTARNMREQTLCFFMDILEELYIIRLKEDQQASWDKKD